MTLASGYRRNRIVRPLANIVPHVSHLHWLQCTCCTSKTITEIVYRLMQWDLREYFDQVLLSGQFLLLFRNDWPESGSVVHLCQYRGDNEGGQCKT